VSGQAWFAFAVVAAVFALMSLTRTAPYLILLGGLTALLVTGVVDPASAFAGFSNPGVVTVGALFVVAAGASQTGVMTNLVQRALGRPRSERRAQARLAGPVVAVSAFLNNTPVVAMLIPVVIDWSRRTGIASSKLLIPLSYAAILGGLCTLIGTSTNLIVNGLLIDSGRPGLGIFDIAPVGIPCAVVGLAVMLMLGRWLLPSRPSEGAAFADPREYTAEMVVAPGGPLVGKTIEAAGLRHLPGLFLAEINRDGDVLAAVGPNERLRANDQLVFVGLVDSVVDLHALPGLAPATRQTFRLDAPRAERCFAEAVLSPSCAIIGQTIREGRFRTRYNAVVLAVSRNGQRIIARIGDIELQPGDAVLVEAMPSFIEQQRNSRDFYLVSRFDGGQPPTHDRAPIALGIMAAMVLAAATGAISMLAASLLAAGAMLATRCCSEETARRTIDWQLLLAIGAAVGLGHGLEQTGAARAIANTFLAGVSTNPWLALAVIFAVSTALSELVTNNAAAVIVFPIAMATAERLGVNHMPFVVAVMIGASASFSTPLGYQTNLMVYGAGGYRVSDFLRMGPPISLALGTTTCAVAPLIWPF
jgi:di/tricarboxylate transporter